MGALKRYAKTSVYYFRKVEGIIGHSLIRIHMVSFKTTTTAVDEKDHISTIGPRYAHYSYNNNRDEIHPPGICFGPYTDPKR